MSLSRRLRRTARAVAKGFYRGYKKAWSGYGIIPSDTEAAR